MIYTKIGLKEKELHVFLATGHQLAQRPNFIPLAMLLPPLNVLPKAESPRCRCR